MSIFDRFKNNDVKVEETKDVLGGGGVRETDVYEMTIAMAFIDYAKSEAMSVTLVTKDAAGNQFRTTQWVSSGKAKGHKNYYTDRNGNNHFLPGYALVNDICLLTTDKGLEEAEVETKAVGIYNFETRTEEPQEREVLIDLIGEKVFLAVEKQVVDKTEQNDATGDYEPTGETREINEVIKAFHADHEVTVSEAKAGVTEPTFINAWRDKYKGVTRNKAKGAKAGGAKPGAPAAGKPASSLFNKK